jgi:leucine dehydrogenase
MKETVSHLRISHLQGDLNPIHFSDFSRHEQVVSISNEAGALQAIVAIHSTALGPAFGGCRMLPYATRSEALRDALRLSRAMSYKAAMAGIAFGGGKCVVLGDPVIHKTEAFLLALGSAIDRLGGQFITADDVGTSVRDMDVLRRVTPYARGLPDIAGEPCPATAYGTLLAIKAAVRYRLGKRQLSDVSVAVQGLGNVGYRLCALLSAAGANLYVSDVRRELVERVQREFAAKPVPSDRILSVEVDVLSPNALGDVLDDRTVPQIRAKVVAGAANNQLRAARHGVALHRRGILYIPDFVANAGGLIDAACEGPGYSADRVLRACEAIYDTTSRVLRSAEREGLAASTIADRMAEARLRRPGDPPVARPLAMEDVAAWT